jgi:nucleotide-binding universal stress UspA family protein
VRGHIERIVVPLDAASENRAAIDAAARLAHRWGAELHGVFVEDNDLLYLARLPFARQVSIGAGVERLNAEQVGRQLRAFAARARIEVEAAARRHGVPWSFEISAAAAADAALTRSERDFLVAGTATRPIGRHFRVETRWWQVIERSAVSYLLIHREWATGGTVVTLLTDRAPGSERLLDAAAQCAEAVAGILTVACPAGLAASPGFEGWLGERLAAYSVTLQIELAPEDGAALLERFAELDCQLLVLGADAVAAQPQWLRQAAARATHGLLIVR